LDIAKYIKELILLNECIILPDLGGFVSKYCSANIDSDKNILSPPSKIIEFRDDLVKDNGLLINHIAKEKKIPVNNARKLVEEFVKEINIRLDKGEKVVLKDVGSFVKDIKRRKIVFDTFRDENYLVDSYGLTSLELFDIEKPENKDDLNFQIPQIKTIRRKRTGLWIAAGIAVLVILLILLIPVTDSEDFQNYKFIHVGKPDSITQKSEEKIIFGQRKRIVQDSVTGEIEDIIDKTSRKEIALMYKEPEVNKSSNYQTEELISQPGKYYLVAGSFKRLENAHNLRAELTTSGYDPQIIQTRNGYFRVILYSFQDRNIAIRELEKVRKGLNRSVWILSI
jgi:nucleoid DNA-binding protein